MPSPAANPDAPTPGLRDRPGRLRSPLRETLRIVLVYVVVAALWIYFSDDLVSRFTDDPRRIAYLSTVKGWAFVAATGSLLGVLLFRLLRGLAGVQAALRESEEQYRLMAENTADVIWLLDLATRRFVYVSPSVVRLLGFTPEEMLGRTLSDVLAPASLAVAERVLPERIAALAAGDATVRTTTRELDQVHRDGHIVPAEAVTTLLLDDEGRATRLLGVSRDLTERRRAEEERARLKAELAQAQKMESVGRLAGGVAHDFNNMLSVIVGRAELALLRGVPEGALRTDLDEILKTAERSAELTHQLLAFARKQTVSPRVLRLNDAVFGTLKMLRRLLGEDVTLVWKPGVDVGTVKIDPSQLDQVLANLAVNARDAIAGHGSLTLETANARLDASDWPGEPDFVPGPYVVLTVSDTGAGMEPEVLQHAFEPFFTTKEPGRGTGLGLATVFGIVRQHGGFIDVKSEPGRGTSFRICLPPAAEEDPPRAAGAATDAVGGSETVLLAEDEASILGVVGKILEGAGYRVLPAQGPSEALRVAAAHPGPIHLLLTDVVMPGMNGRELATRLRELRPEARCLFMSGYTADVIARRGMLDDGVHFIAKPLRRSELLAEIRRVLDAPAAEVRAPEA